MSGDSKERQLELARKLLVRWRASPVHFAHEALGLKTWCRQRDILNAVATHKRVSIRSGHKVAKTTSAAALALWWVATRRRARVIMTAPSHRQVQRALWGEIRRLHENAPIPLGGQLLLTAEGGLHLSGGREIFGFATKDKEKIAGFSGPAMLYIVDEASGVPEEIHEAIHGGPAWVLMMSNPTQTSGAFFDSFKPDSGWHCIHISSLEAAAKAHLEVGPDTGLADEEWCEARLKAWGKDDPRYQVRVLGNFPSHDESAMVPRHVVDTAQGVYRKEMPREGKLQVGVDVARFGNDSSSIVVSRGQWSSLPRRLKGHDTVEVAKAVLEEVNKFRTHPTEKVSVRIDTSNNGGGVKDVLKHGIKGIPDKNLELVEMMPAASSPSPQHSRLRDFVWACGRQWLEAGGTLPPDERLAGDISTPRLGFDEAGRIKVESKKEMRKRIGRSTDDGDAWAMAVYPPSSSGALNKLILSDSFRPSPNRM